MSRENRHQQPPRAAASASSAPEATPAVEEAAAPVVAALGPRPAMPPGPIAMAPQVSPSGAVSFVVWQHGAVQHNGRTFGPGEALPVSEAEAEKLGGAAVKA